MDEEVESIDESHELITSYKVWVVSHVALNAFLEKVCVDCPNDMIATLGRDWLPRLGPALSARLAGLLEKGNQLVPLFGVHKVWEHVKRCIGTEPPFVNPSATTWAKEKHWETLGDLRRFEKKLKDTVNNMNDAQAKALLAKSFFAFVNRSNAIEGDLLRTCLGVQRNADSNPFTATWLLCRFYGAKFVVLDVHKSCFRNDWQSFCQSLNSSELGIRMIHRLHPDYERYKTLREEYVLPFMGVTEARQNLHVMKEAMKIAQAKARGDDVTVLVAPPRVPVLHDRDKNSPRYAKTLLRATVLTLACELFEPILASMCKELKGVDMKNRHVSAEEQRPLLSAVLVGLPFSSENMLATIYDDDSLRVFLEVHHLRSAPLSYKVWSTTQKDIDGALSTCIQTIALKVAGQKKVFDPFSALPNVVFPIGKKTTVEPLRESILASKAWLEGGASVSAVQFLEKRLELLGLNGIISIEPESLLSVVGLDNATLQTNPMLIVNHQPILSRQELILFAQDYGISMDDIITFPLAPSSSDTKPMFPQMRNIMGAVLVQHQVDFD
ncbi:hypothetical protein M427DRAFT_146320 [Gonapodya prolifera JEL478]|uniref:Uncharacterized protein n=1 Tax=Gonapodya prolifera (strain JEL478) TaxID=1344416 RepID=A0A139AAT8_GONPJ|nr:hypothetical protein M427DRAFT_146320 [Gonapodya prolifera JEL478]|eukprot:KXS13941.1 hypothetical protein M427DRAFT_146320 [Gonapodya prolifera JEL478]